MSYEVSSGQVSSGISLTNDYMFVFNGGTANSTAVNEGGSMYLEGGGVANSTTVNEGGSMSVAGTANKTVLNGSGYWGLGEMNVHDGGVANSTTVNSGGSMRVDKGGTADTTIVDNCGSMHVFNGGVANSTAVSSGGSVYVDEGATVAEVTVKDGGVLDIRKGGAAVSIREEGGYVNVPEGANAVFTANSFKDLQLLNDSATLHSGTTATATTVDDFGKLYVYAGGTANATTVNSDGNLYVSSGGTADATIVNDFGSMYVFNGGTANSTSVNSDGSAYVDKGGTMNAAIVNEGGDLHVSGTVNETAVNGADELNCGELYIHGGGSASATVVNGFGWMRIDEKGAANGITVNSCANLVVSTGGVATAIRENGGYVDVADGANVTFANNEFSGLTLSAGSATVHAGTTAKSTTVFTSGELYVYDGGVANGTVLTGTDRWECAELYIYEGGTANLTAVNNGGWIYVNKGGTASSTTVNADGYLGIAKGGRHTGTLTIAENAVVSAYAGSILDFDISAIAPENATLVNDLSRIKGMPDYTLTISASQETGSYTLAAGAAGFDRTITVKNDSGTELGTLAVGTTETIGGTEYLLTNENDELSVTVKAGAPVPAKWTYMVYMAADSDLCQVAIYDIVTMQQARIDPEIEVYILVDRTPVGSKDSGDYVTPHGTYKWDSLWPETRVGKITYDSGLTVTVDWESWGELDTGSIDTLKRFVDWVQEQSPAENYGLIMWDHGGEGAELCWDLTTNPKWEASLTISEVSSLLKEKGNVPLVIFNNCLLGSEITVTQMAGSTEVIVASEPMSYSESTFNYNVFFNTITADMTAQEMAQIMVLNMESPGPGITTMLSSVDVTVPRLAAPLEALAGAVAASGNPADRSVLINAMLKAPQDGCLYDGSDVQQSDLGFLLTRAMEDSDYENTSEGFKKALLDVMAALNESVLEFRSIPAGRGSGIAFCNTVCTIEKIASDSSPEKANAAIKSHITSYYKSNPLWGGLLYDLGAAYLAENEDKLFPVPTFTVRDVEGLVKDRIVSVSDFGCFSGLGESFAGIKLIDEFFFSFTVTAADKSTGKFRAEDEDDAQIAVSLLAPNGTVIATGTDGVSFENLAPGEYFVRLQSDRNCRVTVDTNAEFKTGVDRFDYAGSGKNEKYANGNGSIATATVLAEGFYDGLITYVGDTDYYLIGDLYTERCKIVLEGEAGLTVEEYDRDGTFVRSAEFKDGKYTLTMDSMDYLLVEGVDELEESLNAYSFSVIGLENGSGDIVLADLCGTKDELSWISSTIVNDYDLELSMDDFGHVLQFTTAGTAVDLLNLPAGTYQWRVGANVEGAIWYDGDDFISDNTRDEPKVFQSRTDASDDLFFATPNGTWGSRYCAKHVGTVDGWEGTGEMVSAAGKGRIQDLFFGSADPGTLFLTDSENGDALFLDDAYTGLPEEIEENTARLCRLRVINAGAGDDIIDMTSQQFEYLGGNISLCGGDGDDIIWAGNGKNTLYGDAGNDRLVGASGDDVIVGGIGNDAMHGGGGNDVFTFCDNWGMDTVEQLETGKVTLWFASGSKDNWNADELMYDDGKNSVTVFGVSADQVTLKFGSDGSEFYGSLSQAGAFNGAISQRIFDLTVEPESDENFLAEV